VSWSAPESQYGAAHTIDLPLLFGNDEAWKRAALVAGASWQDIDRHAKKVRQVWADFARGQLDDSGHIPGVLRHKLARSATRTATDQ
jgi:para-nitrobenzyl esterase